MRRKQDTLTEKGFVFLGDNETPYWCTLWNKKPWLFWWNSEKDLWSPLRVVTKGYHVHFPKNLTEEQQQAYHDRHLRCVDVDEEGEEQSC